MNSVDDNLRWQSHFFFGSLLNKGEEIPIFTEVDISFFAHLMREIEPNCAGFTMIHEFRNQIAHSTLTEIQDDYDLDDLFIVMEEAVNAMFKEGPLRQQRREWRAVLHHIQTDDMDKVEPQTKGFRQQVAAVKAKDADVRVEGDQVNAQNMTINNNIFVVGDVSQLSEFANILS